MTRSLWELPRRSPNAPSRSVSRTSSSPEVSIELIGVGVLPTWLQPIQTQIALFGVADDDSVVMQPMAIPSVGGMSIALITLFVIPC
ncbi:MAG: hypothetical protein H7Z17_06610 [Fuerstia sp.]|nr:hypothetical protein [Fuerstiella sp.]